jgi:hypothetical protein
MPRALQQRVNTMPEILVGLNDENPPRSHHDGSTPPSGIGNGTLGVNPQGQPAEAPDDGPVSPKDQAV